MNKVTCPNCKAELVYVDYVLKGGIRLDSLDLHNHQTVHEAVEYHCPLCDVELSKSLLRKNK